MSLTSYIAIGVVIITIIIIFLIFKSGEKNHNKKPYLLSLIALVLIILNWILYLFNFYAIIPDKIGDLIFLPIWIVVSIIGLISAYKEFRNTRTLSMINGWLAIISFIIAIFSWRIGNM